VNGLAGKVAVVTGGAGGLGSAIVSTVRPSGGGARDVASLDR
jgi:NAD(P)-dependent dehydrogenase (short-subunit alcohol dehydrogenase family)